MNYSQVKSMMNAAIKNQRCPVQPFLKVGMSSFVYKVSHFCSYALKNGVSYSQFCTPDNIADKKVYHLPDSSFTFIFKCSKTSPSCSIVSIHDRTLEISLEPNTIYFCACLYTPFGLKKTKVNYLEIKNSVVDFFEVFDSGRLIDRIVSADTFDERIARFHRWTRFFLSDENYLPTITEVCMTHLCFSQKNVTTEELEAFTGCCGSYIRRQFKNDLGISPKTYQSNIRFQKALRYMQECDSLVDVANYAGYYDQSHFYKECKAITGETPSYFLETYEKEIG